jgi:V/A-type H+-transporting ATPase subunit I
MIFGDACYGALIAIVGLALLATSKKGGRSLGVLVTLLGFCTMLWGVMTCSWFGISPEKLPRALVDISFAPFSAAKSGSDVANTNQKIFCFSLALIQLSVAHLKCMFADRKSLKFFGDLGSLLMIWGMFYVVMNMVVDGTKYPLGDTGVPIPIFGGRFVLPSNFPLISIGVLGAGFVLNFIFANYEGSVGKSVLESVKNIISVLLGVVNQFSDIVSYIRLWAVALAGAAISETVNQMAGPMFGKLIMVIFGVVLLVFGHGLNMILNLLSVIVHGVRLNTLEFSQHLGMTWSGVKYRPFAERKEK